MQVDRVEVAAKLSGRNAAREQILNGMNYSDVTAFERLDLLDVFRAVNIFDGDEATPTGMAKLPGLPLPVELLHRELWVADIVYFPIRTELLQAAEALGCRTLSGGGMAVYQAVDAMRIFTGLEPDAERVYAHFQSLLQR